MTNKAHSEIQKAVMTAIYAKVSSYEEPLSGTHFDNDYFTAKTKHLTGSPDELGYFDREKQTLTKIIVKIIENMEL